MGPCPHRASPQDARRLARWPVVSRVVETEGSRTLITGLQDQGSPVELRPRIAVVRSEGIAPSSPACRTGTLLLSYDLVAEGGGLEPPTPVLRRTQLAPALLVLPDSFQNTRGGGGGSRTPRPWLITIFGTVALTDRQLLQRLATRVRRRDDAGASSIEPGDAGASPMRSRRERESNPQGTSRCSRDLPDRRRRPSAGPFKRARARPPARAAAVDGASSVDRAGPHPTAARSRCLRIGVDLAGPVQVVAPGLGHRARAHPDRHRRHPGRPRRLGP